MQDHFQHKAQEWDKGDIRVNGAKTIADAINESIKLDKEMEILDFGVGTGLLGFSIAPQVKKVYGVDTSTKMLEKLQEKNTPDLSIEVYNQDIIKKPIDREFDGLISSMTLHHIEDLDAFFARIYKNIKKGGFIAIADLESEDGTFHADNTGVFHFGFKEEKLLNAAKKAGFSDTAFRNINTIQKPHRDFGVFLFTAKK
ncbi:class I SAM-dependent methyltransferase [Sulfurimonas sp.]|uniref:class I SAM-dependent DNA methyltransferase n=1 Tax=Sulfurimonas sp. TaxID=2022749 RepID=UPI00262E0005|nr:class I SAM-dependent methyltransferase [Sulfurimonas sp.]